MSKRLSVIIPSRDEVFLTKTIDDVFAKCRGECEVVAVLDSDKWPLDWAEVTARHSNLVTIHNGAPIGMRGSIVKGVGSAFQRGAKYIMKIDGHVMLDEGFDVKVIQDLQPNWVMVPRRKRLDADNWTLTDMHKVDIDYHYLSFPDDPNDWGGKGLNGKPWDERSRERRDKPEYDIDDEMASQGSAWAMFTDYFYELELMDEENYGPFWNESQEIFNKAWLSGGRCVVNKKTWYAHLHKGTRHGRGYKLPESWLQKGATFTKRWMYNDAWPKQTLPFSWLIKHFWPVPSWPDNWEEVLYATRKPRIIGAGVGGDNVSSGNQLDTMDIGMGSSGLVIIRACYGVLAADGLLEQGAIDVTQQVRSLVRDNSLDIVVNNSTLTPNQNPFRGVKKTLEVAYSFDGGKGIRIQRQEKDWLIIGPVRSRDDATGDLPAEKVEAGLRQGILEPELIVTDEGLQSVAVYAEGEKGKFCPYCGRLLTLNNGRFPTHADSPERELREVNPITCKGSGKEHIQNPAYTQIDVKSSAYIPAEVMAISNPPRTPAALNDYLIRRFSISPQRLRGPMPIELRDFHRNDLAQLFAELGFKRGAEIGVAEGNYSEVLLKANPECELLLVDPWHAYSDNPQNKSKEKNEYALNEAKRKLRDYHNVEFIVKYSIDAVRDVDGNSLDFCYIDGHHSYPYVMCDIIEWTKKVRSGGIVALDDIYKLNEKWGAGPMEAIYDYTRAMRINPWWLIAAHKSVDAFFVKP